MITAVDLCSYQSTKIKQPRHF